jgi:hypothetical protein
MILKLFIYRNFIKKLRKEVLEMNTYKKRLLRIEEVVNEEEGLTADDVELILSCMPKELADAVLKIILETADEKHAAGKYDHPVQRNGKTKERSGLHGKTLESILNSLPSEYAATLKAKLEIKNK